MIHLLTLAERQLDDAPEAARDLLRRAREEAREATSRAARPLARPAPGRAGRRAGYALEILAARSPVPLHVDALPGRRPPEPIEVTIFFLVSEAVATRQARRGDGAGSRSSRRPTRSSRPWPTTAGAAPTRARLGPARPAGPDRHAGRHPAVDSPPGGGTRLAASIPLGPWRTAREPFLEFGSPDDGGEGGAAIAAILAGRRTGAISVAREWDLEGGVPGIGTRLPIRDHTGREHGAVVVRRVSILPLGQVDDHAVAALGTGRDRRRSFRRWAYRRWGQNRETMAFFLGEPDWRLTDDEAMAVLWFTLAD